MDKYYVEINSDLASSLMISCQLLGFDFETQINDGLESILQALNDEIQDREQFDVDQFEKGLN